MKINWQINRGQGDFTIIIVDEVEDVLDIKKQEIRGKSNGFL